MTAAELIDRCETEIRITAAVFARRLAGYGVEAADLEQEARLALTKLAPRFTPQPGDATYLTRRIRGAMVDAMRGYGAVGRAALAAAKRDGTDAPRTLHLSALKAAYRPSTGPRPAAPPPWEQAVTDPNPVEDYGDATRAVLRWLGVVLPPSKVVRLAERHEAGLTFAEIGRRRGYSESMAAMHHTALAREVLAAVRGERSLDKPDTPRVARNRKNRRRVNA